MKKKYLFILASLAVLASCEEFEPVVTFKYDDPAEYKFYTEAEVTAEHGDIVTLAYLTRLYNEHVASLSTADASTNTKRALTIKKNMVVTGIISTTDQPGNFYKSLYIQDGTAGMEVKIGKNSLYNDYLPGQRIYIACNGLTLGMYGYKSGSYGGQGMVSIGFEDTSGEYENSYIENTMIVDTHIFRADPKSLSPVSPIAISSTSVLPNPKTDTQASNSNIGKLVTLKGLKYADETFVLLYLDSTKNKKSGTNRVFLSDTNGTGKGKAHSINTWAMSKTNMKEHLLGGDWDDAQVASGTEYLLDENGNKMTLGDLKGDGTYPGVEKAAYSVSQYFTMGGTEIQIRTSGYSKFCDSEIPADVIAGTRAIDVTGILSLYQGSLQFTVNSLDDFVYSDTQKKIYE